MTRDSSGVAELVSFLLYSLATAYKYNEESNRRITPVLRDSWAVLNTIDVKNIDLQIRNMKKHGM